MKACLSKSFFCEVFLIDVWYISISDTITINNCNSSPFNTTGYLLKMSAYLTFYHTIWARERTLVTNVSYIRTKKSARRFLKMFYDQKYITFFN